jgi:hypothetical protein
MGLMLEIQEVPVGGQQTLLPPVAQELLVRVMPVEPETILLVLAVAVQEQ